jgi:cobalamin biosynthetic protein CobC
MKHGGDLGEAIAQFGGTAEGWLDLSTGINPWGWPIPALSDAVWQRLPAHGDEVALLEAARDHYRVPHGAGIALAAGTQALIQILPHVMPAGAVAVAAVTYSEHAASFERGGHDIVALNANGDVPAGMTHAVIVNPNNPDGRITGRAAVLAAARELGRRGGWLIIDEAFADIEPLCSSVDLTSEQPIVVLRSFGKFFGLAGLRLGFAIARQDIVDKIATALGPWPVSGPALVIGRAALSDRQWAAQTRERLQRQASRLDTLLARAGLDVIGGTSLFRLARHNDAATIYAGLAQRHIWTRKFAHATDLLRFGLPGDDAALGRLATALDESARPHLKPRSTAR